MKYLVFCILAGNSNYFLSIVPWIKYKPFTVSYMLKKKLTTLLASAYFNHFSLCHSLQLILCNSHANFPAIIPRHHYFLVSKILLIISLTLCKPGSFASPSSHLRCHLLREATLSIYLNRFHTLHTSHTQACLFICFFLFCHNSSSYFRIGTLSGSLSDTC